MSKREVDAVHGDTPRASSRHPVRSPDVNPLLGQPKSVFAKSAGAPTRIFRCRGRLT